MEGVEGGIRTQQRHDPTPQALGRNQRGISPLPAGVAPGSPTPTLRAKGQREGPRTSTEGPAVSAH
ncbi:hypothetical protein UFOVP2_22 [uncultured Caudovirales phage]|uniref:Uncharacterized protein n=1 Tax=uncultured Caudovirales phage TaxID=2100421 RepID=A0A6J5KFZ1_9CAUD|nr:hypothetical protein UFOVP2_22 [uncultured Caudovirales phage]